MLWAITSYFNPVGYKSRLANYRTFRKFLTAPLVAVELSFTGSFELQPGDADILVQLVGGDVMWQKERLLNAAMRHLPPECDAVAWVDCDIIFATDDWAERTRVALNEFAMVQLFGERCNLARDAVVASPAPPAVDFVAQSIGLKIATGRAQPDDLRVAGASWTRGATTGLAWASRRTLLGKHRLYDSCILGNGDRAMVCAAIGRPDYGASALQMNAGQMKHYAAWAEPFFADVGGRVGYIDGRVFHLWHGAWQDRKHAQRHAGLKSFAFDPSVDITTGSDGCWRWSSDKPKLHEYVRSYFASRQEDGPPAMQEQS